MNRKWKVLLASRSEKALADLRDGLAGAPGIECDVRLINNGHADPLYGLKQLPDLLILRFEPDGLEALEALAATSPASRPPLIVVGPAGNAEAVRLAVRSGARDFLPDTTGCDELLASVQRVLSQAGDSRAQHPSAEVVAVLGAAGGVGTSFIACNLADALAREARARTLLMDLDLDDAPLSGFLDLKPERGLPAAMEEVQYLDEHALAGYVAKHKGGLHLMSAAGKAAGSGGNADPERLTALMDVVRSSYDIVVLDIPHGQGPLALAALGMAQTTVLVVQQSVVQLRQAIRLLRMLAGDLGLPDDHVVVVVNRYLKRSTVALEDIRRTLSHDRLLTVPNNYRTVLASVDGGIPILDLDRSSSVARAVVELQQEVTGRQPVPPARLLWRALPRLSGG